jgi:hypothetical protein
LEAANSFLLTAGGRAGRVSSLKLKKAHRRKLSTETLAEYAMCTLRQFSCQRIASILLPCMPLKERVQTCTYIVFTMYASSAGSIRAA